MLPSFRLIAAAFLCGFVAVSVGLRLAASLNHLHAALPVGVAHAASIASSEPDGAPTLRTTLAAPVRYDRRFVATTPAAAPTSPSEMPQAIAPDMPVAVVAPPDEAGSVALALRLSDFAPQAGFDQIRSDAAESHAAATAEVEPSPDIEHPSATPAGDESDPDASPF